jgi:hypothetical protein
MVIGFPCRKGKETLILLWRRTRDLNPQARKGSGFQDRRITIILVLRKLYGILKICSRKHACNTRIWLTHKVHKSLYAGIIYAGLLPTACLPKRQRRQEAIAQAGVYNSATETNPSREKVPLLYRIRRQEAQWRTQRSLRPW